MNSIVIMLAQVGGIGRDFSNELAFQFGVLVLAAIGVVAIVLWMLRS